MKKYLVILCLILAFSFAGCSPQNTPDDPEKETINNETANETPEDIEIVEETSSVFNLPGDYDLSTHYTINYMGRETNNPDIYKYSLVLDKVEELFNITFDFAPMSSKNQDLELAAAADAIPECAWVYLGTTEKAYTLYTDGLTRSIPMEYLQTYAPNYWASMQMDKSFHPTMLAPDSENEDEYFVLYAIRHHMLNLGAGLAFRMDWLENLNIVPKGDVTAIVEDKVYITDECYLMDELSDIIYDFTFSDPDMNSENDTIGLNVYGLKIDDFSYSALLYSAYEMHSGYSPNENGWAVPNIFSSQNKQSFEKLGEWKAIGVIPTGFETATTNDWHKRWAAGNYGATSFEVKYLYKEYTSENSNEFWNENLPLNIFINNPDAKILLAPPLLDNDGSGGHARAYQNFIRSPRAGYFYVREDVDDDKLKRILMVMDFISASPEGTNFCTFGIEGINWQWNEYGAQEVLPQGNLPDNEKWENYEYFYSPCVIDMDNAPEPEKYDIRGFVEKVYAPANWPSLQYCYIDEESPSFWDRDIEWFDSVNMRAYSTAYKAARTAIISATGDLDTIWDNLMSTLDQFGYQEFLNEINTKVPLRDELYYDGVVITPAEKFPLD